MITPILTNPRENGGTLYTFPSASRDLTRAFSNSEYEFAFSHFACLNLPDFRYGEIPNENIIKGIYLDNIKNSSVRPDRDLKGLNEYLKWHIQSYVMNCEVAILNRDSLDKKVYNNEELRTPSERIFFKWLQKVGGIKIRGIRETLEEYGIDVSLQYDETSCTNESDLPLLPTLTPDGKDYIKYKIGNKLYTWIGGGWKSRVLVSKTVQYIGTIDMVNNVNIDYDSFNEIYLNIPAGVGASTEVIFRSFIDDNYEPNNDIKVENIIVGRDDDKAESNKTLYALYDKYTPNGESTTYEYKLDSGYCINFDDDKYYGKSIEAMNLNSNEDFEFNCVLIYYKIKKGDGEWVTNLYGVLFLEEVTTSDYNTKDNKDGERAGYIQRYPKFKKGNSWGLKLDLKIDAQPDSQMELREKDYDDPNGGLGMQMFTEALMQLNDCVKLFYEVKKENTDIEERMYTLENIMSGVDNVYNLSNDVNLLRARIEMFQPSIDSLKGRMDDVEKAKSEIDENIHFLIDKINELEIKLNK